MEGDEGDHLLIRMPTAEGIDSRNTSSVADDGVGGWEIEGPLGHGNAAATAAARRLLWIRPLGCLRYKRILDLLLCRPRRRRRGSRKKKLRRKCASSARRRLCIILLRRAITGPVISVRSGCGRCIRRRIVPIAEYILLLPSSENEKLTEHTDFSTVCDFHRRCHETL